MRTYCLALGWINLVCFIIALISIAWTSSTTLRVKYLVQGLMAAGFSVWAFLAVYGNFK